MTIQELAKRAGVTRRTIRFYVSEGLLDPPLHGRPARYTEDHLAQLEVIKKLKEQYLPLDEIRAILRQASPADVEEALTSPPVEAAPHRLAEEPSSNAALDYIQGVLERGAAVKRLRQRAAPLPAPAAPRLPLASGPLLDSYDEGHPAPDFQQIMASEQISTWHRITLRRGVELHFEGTDPDARSLVTRILELAAGKTAGSPKKEEQDPS